MCVDRSTCSNMKFMGFLFILLPFIVVMNSVEVQTRKYYCVTPTKYSYNKSCSTLAAYMVKPRQYFTSDTEVYFTTGDYHLSIILPVTDVTNLFITGDVNVTIWCDDAYIRIANSTMIQISNIKLINCGLTVGNKHVGSMVIDNVATFKMMNVMFQNSFAYAIEGNNIQGNSTFKNVMIFQDNIPSRPMGGILKLLFQKTINEYFMESNILISGCKFYDIMLQNVCMSDCNSAAIGFYFSQQSNPAEIQIANTTVENVISNYGSLVDVLYSSSNTNESKVIFSNSNFTNNKNKNHSTIQINISSSNQINTNYSSVRQSTGLPLWSFFLLNCYLRNNTSEFKGILNVNVGSPMAEYDSNVSFILHINYTSFAQNNAKETFGKVKLSNYNLSLLSQFVVSQCTFTSNTGFGLEFVAVKHLTFDGPNIFYNNSAKDIIIKFNNTIPLFVGKNVFTRNSARIVMCIFKYIILMPEAGLNFSDNIALSSVNYYTNFVLYIETTDTALYPCIFQFMKYSVDQSDRIDNISIEFNRNKWYSAIIYGASLNSCYWVINCTTRTPGDIYGGMIHYNQDDNLISRQEATMCSCQENTSDCIQDHFNPIQAGRNVYLKLKQIDSNNVSSAVYINSSHVLPNALAPACHVPSPQKMFEVSKNCTTLSYSIISNLTGMCSLYLTTTDNPRPVFVYYVTLQKCPLGFVWSNGKCDCDPVLTRNIPYMQCDPESSSILHVPNTWIKATEDHMDYIYQSSCVSYYCSLDFFFMQLNNSDVQCMNNRTGLICGTCPSHLDAMLGSLRCSKCSNYWLLLIPVFLIIGILLVLVLFVLNLTVVEGKINGFIIYANVLNIFMYKVFPLNSFPFVVVSLANLDWGIETCFYHGMTEYAKVWLRFLFPIYLFFIVFVIILASRYSQRIEKLTRKRVIPVIATIFLLSYNKILLVTNTALFYYVEAYKLRNNEKMLVWGLDTSVPLFGIRFLILFVTCLLIFLLILVPTNVLLIFTKFCYRSKLVVFYLRPFLDAYYAPIKDGHHYFMGLEFFLRAIVFILGNNLLQVYEMLAFSLFTIMVFVSYLCVIQPFKKTINNIIYITFVYPLGLVAIFNVAFQFKQNSTYIFLFNSSFAMSFMLFLGVLYYHVHKYILIRKRTYYNCFTFVRTFVTQHLRTVSRMCYNADNPPRARTPSPIQIRECLLQEELLAYEN